MSTGARCACSLFWLTCLTFKEPKANQGESLGKRHPYFWPHLPTQVPQFGAGAYFIPFRCSGLPAETGPSVWHRPYGPTREWAKGSVSPYHFSGEATKGPVWRHLGAPRADQGEKRVRQPLRLSFSSRRQQVEAPVGVPPRASRGPGFQSDRCFTFDY